MHTTLGFVRLPAFRAVVVVLAVATLLSGCKFSLPAVTSATVTRYISGNPGPQTELAPSQRAAIATWFKEHKSGWSSSFASYGPQLEIRVAHKNGSQLVINVIDSKVVVKGEFGQYERSSGKPALAALRAAIGASSN